MRSMGCAGTTFDSRSDIIAELLSQCTLYPDNLQFAGRDLQHFVDLAESLSLLQLEAHIAGSLSLEIRSMSRTGSSPLSR
jgi:hypothetical protein